MLLWSKPTEKLYETPMVRKMAQETLKKFEGENKEIPEDWEVVRLGEVCKITMGQSPPSSTYNDKGIGLPFLQGKAEFGEIYPRPVKYCSKPLKIAQEGDILISVRAPVGDVNIAPFKCAIGRGLASIKPLNTERLLFLFYFLIYAKKRIEEEGTGSTFKAIRKSNLESFKIPLPTLPEQRKIVRVLDKIQQAIELQDRIIKQAKNLKKSLMQKLFTEGLYGKEQKETEIGLIPKSWEVVKLGEIARFKNGINFTKEQKGNKGILTIDVLNMYSENIYLDIKETNLYRVNLKVNSDYLLKPGDILFVRSSLKREGVGWASLFNGYDEPVTFCGFIIRARLLDKQEILPEFVTYFFRSDIARREFMAGSEQVAITNINQGRLKSFKIPLPPLEKQKQIAHILSVVDEKIEVEQKRKQVLKELFKTMLHKLMSGEIRLKEVEI